MAVWPGGPGWPWPGRPVDRPAYGSRPDSYIALMAVVAMMMLAIVFVTGRSDGSAGWACYCPAAAAALIATVAACLHCKFAWTLLLCLVYSMSARLVSPCLGDSYQRCMMCLMCCVYDDVYDDVVWCVLYDAEWLMMYVWCVCAGALHPFYCMCLTLDYMTPPLRPLTPGKG